MMGLGPGQDAALPATVEAWATRYVLTRELAAKIAPPPLPEKWEERWTPPAGPLRLPAPGRPPELEVRGASPRTPRAAALREPRSRARLLHTFWHHELQAAELMAWAVLAFPDAELEFRRGLLRVCLDEIRHMRLYQAHIESLGYALGAFPVRDWFWQRVPSCQDALSFVALMGMGFEAANLEHAPHFATLFRSAGDEAGARIQEQIAEEELFHVRFASEWFTRWTGGCEFERWCRSLPPPLSPLTLRGRDCDRERRIAAGFPAAFVDALIAWSPEPR